MSVNEGDRQGPQGGQDLWALAGAKPRTIFPKGDITHIMGGVFTAPMAAGQFQQPLGAGLCRGQVGDQVDHPPGWFFRSDGA